MNHNLERLKRLVRLGDEQALIELDRIRNRSNQTFPVWRPDSREIRPGHGNGSRYFNTGGEGLGKGEGFGWLAGEGEGEGNGEGYGRPRGNGEGSGIWAGRGDGLPYKRDDRNGTRAVR